MGWCDAIAPTKEQLTEVMIDITAKSFLTFVTKCQVIANESQVVSVTASSPGIVNFDRNEGCVTCVERIQGQLLSAYLAVQGEYFPGTRDGGSSSELIEAQRRLCQIPCLDIVFDGASQDAHVAYTGECKIEEDVQTNIINDVTTNIMQTLNSNADFLSAITEAVGGGTDLDVEQRIRQKATMALTLNVLNDMQTSMTLNQEIKILPSHSVYSAGLSQVSMLSCVKTALIQSNFVSKMLSDTNIDATTTVINDTNTIQAALDAAKKISDALARAIATNLGAVNAIFLGVIGLFSVFIVVSIYFQVETTRINNQVRELCGQKQVDISFASEIKSFAKEGAAIKQELARG